MAAIFAFVCPSCGKTHEGSPSFSFPYPVYISRIPESERHRVSLGDDLCIAGNDHGEDYFVRVCLEVPIIGHEEPFLWGVWVSLSQRNFTRYQDTWDEPDETDSYFGWFSNLLPYYPSTLNLKTLVRPRSGGVRPYLEIEETDHPLSVDCHRGLTVARAQEIAEHAIHNIGRPTEGDGPHE